MPETETARRVRRIEARKRGEFVGFLACSHGPGRLVKVALPDERRKVQARCPVEGCPEGEHMTGDAMPRPRQRGEECDTELIEDTAPAADGEDDTTPDFGKARRKVSDAAIFEAIPPGVEVLAGEVAAELGYVASGGSGNRATSLVSRLRRMNKRAEGRGKQPPFILSAYKRGQPMKVRRSGGGTIT